MGRSPRLPPKKPTSHSPTPPQSTVYLCNIIERR